jgi:hypothetical protein
MSNKRARKQARRKHRTVKTRAALASLRPVTISPDELMPSMSPNQLTASLAANGLSRSDLLVILDKLAHPRILDPDEISYSYSADDERWLIAPNDFQLPLTDALQDDWDQLARDNPINQPAAERMRQLRAAGRSHLDTEWAAEARWRALLANGNSIDLLAVDAEPVEIYCPELFDDETSFVLPSYLDLAPFIGQIARYDANVGERRPDDWPELLARQPGQAWPAGYTIKHLAERPMPSANASRRDWDIWESADDTYLPVEPLCPSAAELGQS